MFQWGVTEETGCLMQSQNRDVTSKKKPIANHEGDTVAKSYYDFSASYAITAYPTGASLTGIVASAIGDTVTLAGTTSGAGVTTGLVILEDLSLKEQNEDYAAVDMNLMQHAALT